MAKKQKKRNDGRLRKSFTFNSKRYYVYGRDSQELDDNYIAKKNELKAGKDFHDRPTLNQYYEMWTEARRNSVKEATLRCQYFQYKSCAEIVIKSLNKPFGDIRLVDVTVDDIRAVQRALKDGGNSDQTVNDKIAVINHILNDAIKERRVEYNPCVAVKNLKRTEPPARDTFHRALSREETERFFSEAVDSAYYDVFRIAVHTGARIGEIGALFESDIYDNKIHIRRTLTKAEIGNMIIGDTAKTVKGQRDIPINDAISEIIDHQKQINRILYGDKVVNIHETIFKAPEGGLLVASPTNREIKRICKRAGVEVFTMHAFRATFATRAIESGMDPKTLQELLGHASIKMSLDLYGHVMDSTKKEAMKSLKII
ncbi:Site-specific recombinase XerD [Butyrivibrio sp. ob235]|uniref:tyrosine-type recombinase/integrase n=1 Tax=Butyrivibrio sp. ob235 TaxID=1761780 RepID=UPI0008D6185A|nr:tyrosine-type recombinase/integrase [Butyrivibrio sp. ob235]SEL89293.1 Site-specific recombinase XerD [Butyrivibrio sp. ob235]